MLHTQSILGVTVTSEKKKKILEYLLERLRNSKEKTFIITPNPEMLVYASKHLDYHDKLNHADIALADGIGVLFAGWLLGKPLRQRIAGVDFIEELCEKAAEKPLSMGFLGSKDGVAERTAECLQKKYPWIEVVYAHSEWSEAGFRFSQGQKARDKQDHTIQKENKRNTTIDILFVAYGVPKQEEWIYANLDTLPVKAAMGVGGAFDFLSGVVPRAPFSIRMIGLEWLFRLIIQPWRWKRQLALLEFIQLVLRERFARK